MSSILLLSNGHGEDEIASVLAKALISIEPNLTIKAFPLVGMGRPYLSANIDIVGRQKLMPTGGFVRQGARFLWTDIKAGLISLTLEQIRELKRLAAEFDIAVAVGDIYPLWLLHRYIRKPGIFLSTAKSVHISGHYGFEANLMRRACRIVFARDAATAEALKRQGVPAEYCGNLMMDCLVPSGKGFNIPPGREVIGILPGSRDEAYDNMALILQAVARLAQKEPARFAFLTALAGSLSFDVLASSVAKYGWMAVFGKGSGDSIVGRLVNPAVPEAEVLVVLGRFADVLHHSVLVIGMAGTGNEQAVGTGTPVVSFPGRGPQFTRKFLSAQKRLLGDSVACVEGPEDAADEIIAILSDPDRYSHMQKVGRERMGSPGGSGRMAKRILSILESEVGNRSGT